MAYTKEYLAKFSYFNGILEIKNIDEIYDSLTEAISRKYFTSETSWLWDIDFNRLSSKNVKRIILCGRYAYDLALRFEYTDINQNLLIVESSIDKAFDQLKTSSYPFYVVTCFSDEQKVFDRFKEANK